MFEVGPAWHATVSNTHRQYERIELLRPDGVVQMALPVRKDSGTAVEDASSTVRNYCQFEIIDRDGSLMPRLNSDLLAPRGRKQIRIMRGVTDPATGESAGEVPVGTYLLQAVEANRDNPGVLEIQAFDRFIEAKRQTTRTITIANATKVTTAIQNLLRVTDPTLSFLSMATLDVLPAQTVELGADVVEVAVTWALSMGAEVFVDRSDLCVIQPIPIGEGRAVATLSETDGVAIIGASNRWSAREVPNGYIVRAQTSSMDEPVIGEAWDENPNSPTYRYGEYGEVPADPVDTNRYGTVGQARAHARGLLAKTLGGDQEIELEHSPNLAMTTSDRVWLDLPSSGLSGLYTVRKIESVIGNPAAPQRTTVIRSSLSLSTAAA